MLDLLPAIALFATASAIPPTVRVVPPAVPVDPVQRRPRVQPQPVAPKAAEPRSDPARWIPADRVSQRILERGEAGTFAYLFEVHQNGRVSECTITRSIGDAEFDGILCNYLMRFASFHPATDEQGRAVVGHYAGTMQWPPTP